MSVMLKINEIKELIEALDQSSVANLKLTKDDFELKLEKPKPAKVEKIVEQVAMSPNRADSQVAAKSQAAVEAEISVTSVAHSPQPVVEAESNKSTTPVLAPLVGVFYQASSPDSDPFVKEGQTVNEGDTICILEAMKVLNEIKAPASGKVLQIHVKDGDVVEFDQALMEIGE